MIVRAAHFHGGVFGGFSITMNVIASMLLPVVLTQAGGRQTKCRLQNVLDDGTAHYYALADGEDL